MAIRIGETQVVLVQGPFLRELLARVDFQGPSVGTDRLTPKFAAFYTLGTIRLVVERVTQVGLGPGPILGELLARRLEWR